VCEFQEIAYIFRTRKIDFFLLNFIHFCIIKMDQNKYRNIYNSINDNYSYQTYYINSISNNYQNSTITQEQYYSIKEDLMKYMNK
jgi:hypothetical protein